MKKRVLVADDDPGICDALSLILMDAGYDVTTTLDGRSVLDLNSDLPDLILLDIRMSGIDGREVCRQLKSQSHTTHIPVVMISANRDTPVIAGEVGAEGFVMKPFEMDDLLAVVEEHAGKCSGFRVEG
jgi:DNA-binding response OmpR family regulator